ncbi:hypothetical protein J437_LFUL016600 [Ladona fulva]|uniref:Tc1-like transposase DDE domain-containing protein n=1 Tax=Ladona fulva TaxID=123851 RepID=A0A8K0P760_LADFU|nr:hypothetical protein J437_LFUL016600 [Ladona fulva]
MNSENYLKWIKNQLIPNLPPKSVVVIDNAPYHNVQLNRPPNSNAKKDTMKEWLDSRGQQYSSKEKKIELLPPYHPELNPIENIWGIMKNWVSTRNVTFKLEDVKKLVMEKCANIGKEEWEGVCEKAKGIENYYMKTEIAKDNSENELSINTESGDDSSSDFLDSSDEKMQ